MDRLKNPATWIAFAIAVIGAMMIAPAIPASWHPYLDLAGGILGIAGSLFFGAGIKPPPGAAAVVTAVALLLLAAPAHADGNIKVDPRTGHVTPAGRTLADPPQLAQADATPPPLAPTAGPVAPQMTPEQQAAANAIPPTCPEPCAACAAKTAQVVAPSWPTWAKALTAVGIVLAGSLEIYGRLHQAGTL